MYTKKKYSARDMLKWTRREVIFFIVIASIVTTLYEILGLSWLMLPWFPIALVGTAVAFLIGFQNNAAYGRIWEARKIWGGIVNTSRTWTMMIKDMVTNEHAQTHKPLDEINGEVKTLVYRHIAWITTLRHAMRQRKPWETFAEHKTNQEWLKMLNIPEHRHTVEEELSHLLSKEELDYILTKTNKSAVLVSMQSKHLRTLKESGHIWEFSFLELEAILKELFDLQGKSERIKNFPYPRQYATLGYNFVNAFVFLIPFGVVPEFAKIGQNLSEAHPIIGSLFVWLAIPFSVMISWIFNTMQRIGTVGENPFEGSANDVPISTISRGIEIDLREMLDEDESTIPEPLAAHYDVQM
jgi:ion channel-forming bestrophin family protein